MFQKYPRYSDSQKQFGPILYYKSDNYKEYALYFTGSVYSEDYERYCGIHLKLGKNKFILMLPKFVNKIFKNKSINTWYGTLIDCSVQYGFSVHDRDYLEIFYGVQSDDSEGEKRFSCFLPFLQWRLVEEIYYDADGNEFKHPSNKKIWSSYDREECIDTEIFRVIDNYDGNTIEVEVQLHDSIRRLGTGWFKWLGYIIPKRINRFMYLRFSEEVGSEKGSYKGGTLGVSTGCRDGLYHEDALKEYCEKSKNNRDPITYLGRYKKNAEI